MLRIEHRLPDDMFAVASPVVVLDELGIVNPQWLTAGISEVSIDRRPGDTCGDVKLRNTEPWEPAFLFDLAHYLFRQSPMNVKVETFDI